MKHSALRIMPAPLVAAMREAKACLYTGRYFLSDWARFRRNYPIREPAVGERGLQARLNYYSHALEKGLSHTPMRPGFGAAPIESLIRTLAEFLRRGYSRESLAYKVALAVLHEYLRAHEDMCVTPETIRAIPSWLVTELQSAIPKLGGVSRVESCESGALRGERSFEEVLVERRSIREYGPGGVDPALVKRAVEMATRAPSACNRQTARVRALADPRVVAEATRLQGGLGGYATPPLLLAITADLRDFLDPAERHQPFVDGGIFGMTLLLSLESLGLAACPLHAMLPRPVEAKVRALLGMEDGEVLVLFVAVGNRPESVTLPLSTRYPAETIMR